VRLSFFDNDWEDQCVDGERVELREEEREEGPSFSKEGEGCFLWVEPLGTVWSPLTGCKPRVNSILTLRRGQEAEEIDG